MLNTINPRSQEILRLLAETYVASGGPVGSKTIAQLMSGRLSPATIRHTMVDLEQAGLLFAPHHSAGRVPTEAGLRLFVDGLLEVSPLTETDAQHIKAHPQLSGISGLLSGLSQCAGLVATPASAPMVLKQLEFVALAATRVLVVLVLADGQIENRVLELPETMPQCALQQASNYLNHHLQGRTLPELCQFVAQNLACQKTALNALAQSLVVQGVALLGDDLTATKLPTLIVRGQANLLDNVKAIADLERLKTLFDQLEQHETLAKLLNLAEAADGVQIFIGAENNLFQQSGCSLIIAPYKNVQQQVVGAIGVIGPTHLNYGRIIPVVDFTAKLLSQNLYS